MLTRVIHPHMPIVALDVGANVGAVSRRIRAEFRDATVYAFEPAPDVYERLAACVADDDRIRPVPLAVGDRTGHVDFHLTADRVLSSVLTPTAHGSRAYGGLVARERTLRVPITTLDDWARAEGLEDAQVLKIDVQGLELAVLRGAGRLLASGVLAVNSEAQLIPEYEGAATFSEIDLFLRERGFTLHQVHELWHQGEEHQSSCVDALWLRNDALSWLREDPYHAWRVGWADLVARGLRRCRARGCRRIALYGAGEHTREALAKPRCDVRPDCVLDDNPECAGRSIAGVPVVHASCLPERGIDGVVISSHFHERRMWERSRRWRERGVEVVRLYGPGTP
jgi:FkbM family methyltransferase